MAVVQKEVPKAAAVQRFEREASCASKRGWTGQANRHLYQCKQAGLLPLKAGGHDGGLHILRPRESRGVGRCLANTFLQQRTTLHFTSRTEGPEACVRY